MKESPNYVYYLAAQRLIDQDHHMYSNAYSLGGRDYEQRMKHWESEIFRHHDLADRALKGDQEAILTILTELGV